MIRSLKSLSLRAQWLYVDFLLDTRPGLTTLFNEARKEAGDLRRAMQDGGHSIWPPRELSAGVPLSAEDLPRLVKDKRLLTRIDALQIGNDDEAEARYYFTRALVYDKALSSKAIAAAAHSMIADFRKEKRELAL